MTRHDRSRPVIGSAVPVGFALWHLEEARDWTIRWIEGISQDAIDRKPVGHRHSVATLLYHIAVFEVDWLYTDIVGNDYDMDRRIPGCPEHISALLPYPLLEEDRRYTTVSGEAPGTHVERLNIIRADLIEVLSSMTVEEFRKDRPSGDGTTTAEWVLMHLARHESEHRGQIWEARTAAEAELAASA